MVDNWIHLWGVLIFDLTGEARITYQNVTYHLGVFEKYEDALNARKEAEEQLRKDSGKFPQWVLHKRKEETKK